MSCFCRVQWYFKEEMKIPMHSSSFLLEMKLQLKCRDSLTPVPGLRSLNKFVEIYCRNASSGVKTTPTPHPLPWTQGLQMQFWRMGRLAGHHEKLDSWLAPLTRRGESGRFCSWMFCSLMIKNFLSPPSFSICSCSNSIIFLCPSTT